MTKKPYLRQGYDEYFPPSDYILIMRKLMASQFPVRYKQLLPDASKDHGIKLFRMIDCGLIKKLKRGYYEITPYGRKVLLAVTAYKKAMSRKD